MFTPFKGTNLYKYCIDHGYIRDDSEAGNLNSESVLNNNTLSHDEIKGLLRTFPLYVHFCESEYPYIKKAEALTNEGDDVFHKLAERYVDEHFNRSKA